MKFSFDDLKDSNGFKSSMRLNSRLVIIVCATTILAVAAYIVISAVKGSIIDGGVWAGMGGFVTGIATVIGGTLWNQQQQKKHEEKPKENQIIHG